MDEPTPDDRTDDRTGVRIDARQLTVLAHPLRSRLLSALRTDGAATATDLAGRLGTNTGATSYHLRRLAEVGLVTEEDRPGSGKRRWWRAAQSWHRIQDDDFAEDDADARAALDWLTEFYRSEHTRGAARWRAEARQWPVEWRAAATTSDFLLDLAPEQLRALNDEVGALIERYRTMPAAEGAERVVVLFENHPVPRRT